MTQHDDRSTDLYSLDELSALSGTSKRTIRYYIQLGLVDRPVGETRGARYGPIHFEQLARIRRLSHDGFSLERIRALQQEGNADHDLFRYRGGTVETWTRLFVSDGIELGLNPQRAQLSPEGLRALIQGVLDLCEEIRRKDSNGTDPNGPTG